MYLYIFIFKIKINLFIVQVVTVVYFIMHLDFGFIITPMFTIVIAAIVLVFMLFVIILEGFVVIFV